MDRAEIARRISGLHSTRYICIGGLQSVDSAPIVQKHKEMGYDPTRSPGSL